MEKMIDEKVLNYIPEKLKNRVVACDRFDRFPSGYTYNVIFDDDETTIFADSVVGLKWACKEVLKGRTGEIYG